MQAFGLVLVRLLTRLHALDVEQIRNQVLKAKRLLMNHP